MSKKFSTSSSSSLKEKSVSSNRKDTKNKLKKYDNKKVIEIENSNLSSKKTSHKHKLKHNEEHQQNDINLNLTNFENYNKIEKSSKKRNHIKKHKSTSEITFSQNIEHSDKLVISSNKSSSSSKDNKNPNISQNVNKKTPSIKRSSTSTKFLKISKDISPNLANPKRPRRSHSYIIDNSQETKQNHDEKNPSSSERKKKRKSIKKKKDINAIQFLTNSKESDTHSKETQQTEIMKELKKPVPGFLEFQIPLIDITGTEMNERAELYSFLSILNRLHNSLM